MTNTTFTVYMHTELVDRLDECFSPLDGIHAVDGIFLDLPILHHGQAVDRYRAKPRKTFKAYRGRFGWFDLRLQICPARQRTAHR